MPLRRRALDSAKTHQSVERLRGEPALVALRAERFHEVIHFPLTHAFVERDEEIRTPEPSVVLRNLVLQHQMIAERVPGELGHHAMILVQITTIVREDQIPCGLRLQLLEELLDLAADIRK